ncbi:MAG: BPSS1780 family membrane protein [Thermomonas sp.]|uniref:BPSS1780 family membrane protein n=1 Tax=Thermomonas sp. TaxID=1971895 RepID=UPI0039E320B3
MQIRKLSAGQGLVWFKQAIDLGAKNPRAVFGAALLLILALYAAALLLALGLSAVVGLSGTGGAPDLGKALAVGLALSVLVVVLVPILLGGLMHVVREAEAGRPVRARDVFAPLRDARGRSLGLLGLLQIALAMLGGALVVAIAGNDYWREYVQAMQGAMQGQIGAMPQPKNAGLLFLVQLVFNYFSYALMLFSIPLMLFSGSNLLDAIRNSLRASVRNVGANLLAGVLFVGALLLATLVTVLVAGLAGIVGGAVHPALGVALTTLLMLGFAAVVLVLVVGGAYLAWRDTFGDGAPPSQQAVQHGIEV